MTLEEALEYLNLAVNSRPYLVRKRYLELKRDYLKAIYNAPSEHFGSLYRENLQKIEEAYHLLAGKPEGTNDGSSDIQKTIKQIQQVVDTFLKNKGTLDVESREQLKDYIQQIDQLKDSLKKDGRQKLPVKQKPSTRWEMKDQPGEAQPGKTKNLETGTIPDKRPRRNWIERLMEIPYARTLDGRKYLYDQFLMWVILIIAVLGIAGAVYVVLPLFFSN